MGKKEGGRIVRAIQKGNVNNQNVHLKHIIKVLEGKLSNCNLKYGRYTK